ncbi:hypothetical protein BD410DRAFT_576543 [Rickenella mellea]|uniref:Uncharacterized protein n=1 Tax=Rickenella mellea TaxID=50990 RepID=A0A4Y7QGR5_9AGAM|nr:hypothetical protein BD410DRAFT_576543 [Rickenella mellea]
MASGSRQTDVTEIDFDVMSQIHEATMSPSAVTQLLSDPVVLRTAIRPRGSSRSSHSRSRDGKRREKDSDVLTEVLAEEERQLTHLKAVLNSTAERLYQETRRAEQAEHRAELAETRARDAHARIMQSETIRHQSQMEISRAREEVMQYKLQLDVAERELRRAEEDIETLEEQLREAESAAAKSRGIARQYQQALRDHQAREDGREEGRRLGARKAYSEGRSDGWSAGKAEGLEEGRWLGHKQGWQEGKLEGHEIERKRAQSAIDRLMAQDKMTDDQSIIERTKKWAEDIEPTTPISVSPSMKPYAPIEGEWLRQLREI